MALLVAVKFAPEETGKLYDPGPLEDLKPDDYVIATRGQSSDVGVVACLEHKATAQINLRQQPFPRLVRRATEHEVEQWLERKKLEKAAYALAKVKARELHLDLKISHVRYETDEPRAVIHFASDQRIDFRALVKEMVTALNIRVEMWQLGVRDEAKFLDGMGVCGLQTCCSSWMKDFRPITIKMAKDQDIGLPPAKLSGQCGRLLCCLSYEVDQYREMSREALPKGATVRWDDKDAVIVDRNLIAGTYLVSTGEGGLKTVKAEALDLSTARVPDQMRKFGKSFGKGPKVSTKERERPAAPAAPAAESLVDDTEKRTAPAERSERTERENTRGGGAARGRSDSRSDSRSESRRGPQRPPFVAAAPMKPVPDDADDDSESDDAVATGEVGAVDGVPRPAKRRKKRRGKRKSGGAGAAAAPDAAGQPQQGPNPAGRPPMREQRPKPAAPEGTAGPAAEGGEEGAKPSGRRKKRRRH